MPKRARPGQGVAGGGGDENADADADAPAPAPDGNGSDAAGARAPPRLRTTPQARPASSQAYAPAGAEQAAIINLVESADGKKSCTHEVLWPPPGAAPRGGDAVSAVEADARSPLPPPGRPGPPARAFPFALDPFQQVAVDCLEAGHDVLVAAHTSAGKTVVAEYAFAMALRDGARCIYTSPLKALSNQKYRELKALFGDVGLMTGDAQIDPSASCLVMTTEILRSMLYAGGEAVREARAIVYDEVHYLRDPERGVAWEETIAMAPPGCALAFLSATLPNAAEFAAWVAAAHARPCHVVYTDYRPTPLQHFLLPSGEGEEAWCFLVFRASFLLFFFVPRRARAKERRGPPLARLRFFLSLTQSLNQPVTNATPHAITHTGADGLYLVVDDRGAFREDNFRRAVAALDDAASARRSGGGGGGGRPGGASGPDNAALASAAAATRPRSGGVSAAAGAGAQLVLAPVSSFTSALGGAGGGGTVAGASAAATGSGGQAAAGGARGQTAADVHRLVKTLYDRNYDPLIVFAFSKAECEALARGCEALDLSEEGEPALVDAVVAGALASLSEQDRALPQARALLPLLRRGVGVHHSGLLPVLKEAVELLFGEGLLKVLFATETFSTGLNMPAKTVVFARARKFDGAGFRWLRSGEYIQMAGRAGRRGKDDRGVVVMLLDEKMEPSAAREMLRGLPDPLVSAFHLRYAMLLSLARAEGAGARPEALLRASFRQFQAQRAAPRLAARAEALERARGAVAAAARRVAAAGASASAAEGTAGGGGEGGEEGLLGPLDSASCEAQEDDFVGVLAELAAARAALREAQAAAAARASGGGGGGGAAAGAGGGGGGGGAAGAGGGGSAARFMQPGRLARLVLGGSFGGGDGSAAPVAPDLVPAPAPQAAADALKQARGGGGGGGAAAGAAAAKKTAAAATPKTPPFVPGGGAAAVSLAVCLAADLAGRRAAAQRDSLEEAAVSVLSATLAAAGASAGAAVGAAVAMGGGAEQLAQDVDGGAWGVVVGFQAAARGKAAAAANAAGDSSSDDDEGGGGKAAAAAAAAAEAAAAGGDASAPSSSSSPSHFVDVLVNCAPGPSADAAMRASGTSGAGSGKQQQREDARTAAATTAAAAAAGPPQLWPPGRAGGVPVVLRVPLSAIDRLSAARLRALAELRTPESRAQGLAVATEVLRRHAGGAAAAFGAGAAGGAADAAAAAAPGPSAKPAPALPLLDAERDLGAGKAAAKLQARIAALEARLAQHPLARAAAAAAAALARQRRRQEEAAAAAEAARARAAAPSSSSGKARAKAKPAAPSTPVAVQAEAPKEEEAAALAGAEGDDDDGTAAAAAPIPLPVPALAAAASLRARLALAQCRAALGRAAHRARLQAQAAGGTVLHEELRARQRVLLRLGYLEAPEGAQEEEQQEGATRDDEGAAAADAPAAARPTVSGGAGCGAGAVASLKGRVAAGLSSCDELVMTELLFGGAFTGLTPEQAAALCSCLVWAEKAPAGAGKRRRGAGDLAAGSGGAGKRAGKGGGPGRLVLPEDLRRAHAAVKDAARRVGRVAAECRVPLLPGHNPTAAAAAQDDGVGGGGQTAASAAAAAAEDPSSAAALSALSPPLPPPGTPKDVEAYVERFRPELMPSVALWARGASFAEALGAAPPGTYAGALVRALRRLEEVTRQAAAALRAVGETGLADTFDAAGARVRRGVVSAPSLYL